jgi:HEAT repeat protein
VKSLAEFQVQRSVVALASVARHDREPSVRAQAVSSLASINHESVFPAVLIGMADESREVRASAARSLSRLSFDRADAYARVIETSDEQTLRDVASASIKAGIVSQGIDRLASSDHRQAYEAYSIVSLLAKAKMTEPVLEAISSHVNLDVRLAAVRLLATIDHPEVFEKLRELAVNDGLAEQVRTALLEAMYKLDKAKAEQQESPTSLDVETESSYAGDNVKIASKDEPEFVSEIETHVDEL